uniref:Uncharacterized protein n=1 Tax=Siphoviridae sp. cttnq1 TaxID=2826495 RepID=A0A8S5QZV8_9CAUD|nr:MAG TPA: hypothetical protein [Siphoviridae sp. cttnq1]
MYFSQIDNDNFIIHIFFLLLIYSQGIKKSYRNL